MKKHTKVDGQVTIGLDLGDRHSQIHVLDARGETIEETHVRTTPGALSGYFELRRPALVALEVGAHSPWVKRLLEKCGHQVLVANPRKTRMIFGNDTKTDRSDAQWLARMARFDPKLLAPIGHRSERCQADLAIVRSRDALVRGRTALINHVRGAVKSMGGRVRTRSMDNFHKTASPQIPEQLKPALDPILQTLMRLNNQIRKFDKAIESMARRRYPQTQLLRQVKGVGPVTSVCFLLTLEDASRFKNNRSVGAYLGLTQRKDQSGTQDPQLRITKAGDGHVRRLLVGSAQHILGPFGADSDLRRWGLELASRGGKNAKKRAVVAVARKLAVLLLSLWKSAEVYEPLRHTSVLQIQDATTQAIPA